MPTLDMAAIEKKTKEFEKVKRDLDDLGSEIKGEAEAIKKKYATRLRTLINAVIAKREDLHRAVRENRELFEKPRTQVFEGITVGLKKGKGKLSIEDEELTMKLIRKHLPEMAGVLIRTVEEPCTAAIKKLPDADMKKIAVEIIGKEDRVIIESVDDTIQKVLNSLIKVQVEELNEEYKEAA
jgi:hypothetical protein